MASGTEGNVKEYEDLVDTTLKVRKTRIDAVEAHRADLVSALSRQDASATQVHGQHVLQSLIDNADMMVQETLEGYEKGPCIMYSAMSRDGRNPCHAAARRMDGYEAGLRGSVVRLMLFLSMALNSVYSGYSLLPAACPNIDRRRMVKAMSRLRSLLPLSSPTVHAPPDVDHRFESFVDIDTARFALKHIVDTGVDIMLQERAAPEELLVQAKSMSGSVGCSAVAAVVNVFSDPQNERKLDSIAGAIKTVVGTEKRCFNSLCGNAGDRMEALVLRTADMVDRALAPFSQRADGKVSEPEEAAAEPADVAPADEIDPEEEEPHDCPMWNPWC